MLKKMSICLPIMFGAILILSSCTRSHVGFPTNDTTGTGDNGNSNQNNNNSPAPVTCTAPDDDIYYVKTSGSDSTGTGSMECPFKSIEQAITTMRDLEIDSGEVHIAAGIYDVTKPVQLEAQTSIKGGYNFNNWSDRRYLTAIDRDNIIYRTVVKYTGPDRGDLSAMIPAHTIRASGADVNGTLVEGLTIYAEDTGDFTTAVLVVNGANPELSYNTIAGSAGSAVNTTAAIFSLSGGYFDHNKIDGGNATSVTCGIALMANDVTIEYNTIEGGTASDPASGNSSGICAQLSSGLQISSNYINGGTATTRANGIWLNSGVTGVIDSNTINGGIGDTDSADIFLDRASSPNIINNVLIGGQARTNTSMCIGMISGSQPHVMNNTMIVGTGTYAYGIWLAGGASSLIENNIFYSPVDAQNWAILAYDVDSRPTGIRNNDFSWISGGYYWDPGISFTNLSINGNPIVPASDNVSMDPMFANFPSMDLHLTSATNALVGLGGLDLSAYFTVDKDGAARTVPFTMGAYQTDGIIYTLDQQLSPPNISPGSGTVVAGTQINMFSPDSATIHYTMGSSPDDPTINDPVYDPGSKPTMGSSAITVKAVAFKTGYLPSAVASANYTPPAIPVTLAIKVGNSIVNYTGGPPTYYNINYGDIAQFRVVFLDPQQHEIPFFMAQAPSQYAWSANGPTAIPIAIPVRSDNTFVFPSDVGSLLTIWPSGWFTTFNLSVFVMGPPDGYVLSGPNSATVLIMLHSSDAPSVKIAPASGTYPYSQRIMYAVNKVGSGMSKDGAACRIDGPLHSWTTCPTLMLGLTSDTNLHLLEARACPCSGSPPVCNTICSQDSDYVYATPTTFICSNCAGDLIIANNLHATPHTGSVTVTFDLLSGAINPYAGLYTDASCTLQAYGGGMPPPPLQAQIYPTTLVTHTATINNVPTGAYYFSVADQGFYPWYGGPPVMSKECVPVIVP